MINFKTKKHDPIGMGTAKEECGTVVLSRGLTKREYFAAMALQGLLVAPSKNENSIKYAAKVRCAVKVADALIAQLNKPTEQDG